MCLPTSHLPCQSEACSAPADGDRLPARAPKDMDNLLKIVVSESSAVKLDGLLEAQGTGVLARFGSISIMMAGWIFLSAIT